MTTQTPRRAVLIALSLSAFVFCVWTLVIATRRRPIERRISIVALSRTHKWLAAGTSQGRITIWRRQSPDNVPRQIDFPYSPLNDLRFSPDESRLAIAGKNLGVYALEKSDGLRLLRADEENYGSVRFSADGQSVLVVIGKGLIETIDTHSGATRLKICCSTIYSDVAFTPDGQAISNAGHWPSLWNPLSGTLIGRLTTNRQFQTFRPIAFDPSRGTILMGSQDGRVYVWNLKSRRLVTISSPQSGYVDTLAVSTGGWVVYAGFGGVLRLWNPQTGQQCSFPAARPTSNVVLNQNGASIIFGTADGRIEFWDADTGRRLSSLKTPAS